MSDQYRLPQPNRKYRRRQARTVRVGDYIHASWDGTEWEAEGEVASIEVLPHRIDINGEPCPDSYLFVFVSGETRPGWSRIICTAHEPILVDIFASRDVNA